MRGKTLDDPNAGLGRFLDLLVWGMAHWVFVEMRIMGKCLLGISLVLWDFTLLPPGDLFTILEVLFFEKSTIDIGDGKKFTIECRNISAQNKYIQSASMNGKELNRAWFTHEELMQGGTLLLNMGHVPIKNGQRI